MIEEHTPPKDNGIPVLGMPNVPSPLHGCAPRIIMGAAKWKLERVKCFMRADYKCEVCGRGLSIKEAECHELYKVDYKNLYSKFDHYVCICKDCHKACHSGRMLSLFTQKDRYNTKKRLLETAERTFKLVHQWNMEHIEQDPIKLCDTWVAWSEHPALRDAMLRLIDRYEIEFYRVPVESWLGDNWGKWYLEYEGKKYKTPYESMDDWEEKYRKK